MSVWRMVISRAGKSLGPPGRTARGRKKRWVKAVGPADIYLDWI